MSSLAHKSKILFILLFLVFGSLVGGPGYIESKGAHAETSVKSLLIFVNKFSRVIAFIGVIFHFLVGPIKMCTN